MKATELRKGNYIYNSWNDNGFVVEAICKGTIYIKPYIPKGMNTPITSLRYSQLKPIPLTEEWYIKFGYEGMQELIVDMIHNAIHPISNNIALWGATISGLKVHQLQNLYFALTSKELMI